MTTLLTTLIPCVILISFFAGNFCLAQSDCPFPWTGDECNTCSGCGGLFFESLCLSVDSPYFDSKACDCSNSFQFQKDERAGAQLHLQEPGTRDIRPCLVCQEPHAFAPSHTEVPFVLLSGAVQSYTACVPITQELASSVSGGESYSSGWCVGRVNVTESHYQNTCVYEGELCFDLRFEQCVRWSSTCPLQYHTSNIDFLTSDEDQSVDSGTCVCRSRYAVGETNETGVCSACSSSFPHSLLDYRHDYNLIEGCFSWPEICDAIGQTSLPESQSWVHTDTTESPSLGTSNHPDSVADGCLCVQADDIEVCTFCGQGRQPVVYDGRSYCAFPHPLQSEQAPCGRRFDDQDLGYIGFDPSVNSTHMICLCNPGLEHTVESDLQSKCLACTEDSVSNHSAAAVADGCLCVQKDNPDVCTFCDHGRQPVVYDGDNYCVYSHPLQDDPYACGRISDALTSGDVGFDPALNSTHSICLCKTGFSHQNESDLQTPCLKCDTVASYFQSPDGELICQLCDDLLCPDGTTCEWKPGDDEPMCQCSQVNRVQETPTSCGECHEGLFGRQCLACEVDCGVGGECFGDADSFGKPKCHCYDGWGFQNHFTTYSGYEFSEGCHFCNDSSMYVMTDAFEDGYVPRGYNWFNSDLFPRECSRCPDQCLFECAPLTIDGSIALVCPCFDENRALVRADDDVLHVGFLNVTSSVQRWVCGECVDGLMGPGCNVTCHSDCGTTLIPSAGVCLLDQAIGATVCECNETAGYTWEDVYDVRSSCTSCVEDVSVRKPGTDECHLCPVENGYLGCSDDTPCYFSELTQRTMCACGNIGRRTSNETGLCLEECLGGLFREFPSDASCSLSCPNVTDSDNLGCPKYSACTFHEASDTTGGFVSCDCDVGRVPSRESDEVSADFSCERCQSNFALSPIDDVCLSCPFECPSGSLCTWNDTAQLPECVCSAEDTFLYSVGPGEGGNQSTGAFECVYDPKCLPGELRIGDTCVTCPPRGCGHGECRIRDDLTFAHCVCDSGWAHSDAENTRSPCSVCGPGYSGPTCQQCPSRCGNVTTPESKDLICKFDTALGLPVCECQYPLTQNDEGGTVVCKCLSGMKRVDSIGGVVECVPCGKYETAIHCLDCPDFCLNDPTRACVEVDDGSGNYLAECVCKDGFFESAGLPINRDNRPGETHGCVSQHQLSALQDYQDYLRREPSESGQSGSLRAGLIHWFRVNNGDGDRETNNVFGVDVRYGEPIRESLDSIVRRIYFVSYSLLLLVSIGLAFILFKHRFMRYWAGGRRRRAIP